MYVEQGSQHLSTNRSDLLVVTQNLTTKEMSLYATDTDLRKQEQ